MADQDQNTRSVTLHPLDSASGYPVCPGLFDRNGAVPLGYDGAVSFTVHSAGATAVTLLLYHRG